VSAFDFSVGDFVALANLIYKVCKAIDETSESFEEFSQLQIELETFKEIITQLEKAITAGTSFHEKEAQRLKTVLDGNLKTLQAFDEYVAK
jgi:cell shape-determining protein MreC